MKKIKVKGNVMTQNNPTELPQQRILLFLQKESETRLKPIILLLLLMISLSVAGQDLDQDCRPLPLPSQCRQIEAELEDRQDYFEREINRLTEQRVGNEAGRKRVTDRINALKRQRNTELARLRNELQQCRQQHNTSGSRRQEAASTLDAIFTGRVTARTTEGLARGPFTENVRVRLQFSRNRCEVIITEFPPIVFGTLVGDVTITKIGGGTGRFFPISGEMTMPVSLKADIPILADSEASAALTTENSRNGAFNVTGSRLTRTNNAAPEACGTIVNGTTIQCPLTLVGTTTFQGGLLGGDQGSITIGGNLAILQPSPPHPPPSRAREECLERCQRNYEICREQRREPDQTPPNCQAVRETCRQRCPRN
jgi:hypothetical protein